MSKAKKTAKSNKKSKKTLGKKELRVLITQYLSQQPGEYIHYKQLFRALKLTNGPLKMLAVDILNEMIEAGEVTHNEEGDVSYNGHSQICEGVFTRTAGGKNFVDLPDGIGVSVYDEDTLHFLTSFWGLKVKTRAAIRPKSMTNELTNATVLPIFHALGAYSITIWCSPLGMRAQRKR